VGSSAEANVVLGAACAAGEARVTMEKKEENDSCTVLSGGSESKLLRKLTEAGFSLLRAFPCWTGFDRLPRYRSYTRKPSVCLGFLLPTSRSC
jgi:hypothetical protein